MNKDKKNIFSTIFVGIILAFLLMFLYAIVYTSFSSENSSSSTNGASSSVTHYCSADGCTKKATKSYYFRMTGQTDYYCTEHYNEIISILSDMEEDVGKGSYSKHTCEECDREGTYSIVGFSGETEYYCSKHYSEMKEMLEKMLD